MKNIKRLLYIFPISILFTSLAVSQKIINENYQASVNFKIRNLGFDVDGHFKEARFNVIFDEKDLSKSSFSGNVSVASIDSDNKKRDEHLKKEDYFDVSHYPNIFFESSKIILKSKDNYIVTGKLRIKDVTKQISIPIKANRTPAGLELSTYFEIDRLDYKVGGNSFVLSDKVKITINYLQK